MAAPKTRTVLLRQSVKWEGVLHGPKAELQLPPKLAAELVASGAAMYPPKPDPVEQEDDGKDEAKAEAAKDSPAEKADIPTANA